EERVPDLDRPVAAQGRDALRTGAHRERGDRAGVAVEDEARAAVEVEKAHAVPGDGDDRAPAADEARPAHADRVEEGRGAGRLGIPQLHVPGAVDEEALAVGAELDALDALAELDCGDLGAGGGVEEARALVPAGGRDALAVGIEGRRGQAGAVAGEGEPKRAG